MGFKFETKDFEPFILLEELEQYLITIIKQARESSSYNQIWNELNIIEKEFKKVEGQKITYNNINTFLLILEKIQSTSLKINSLLPVFLQQDYNSIEYTFYYEGQRYTTKQLSAEWLKPKKHGKALGISLTQAVNQIKSNINNEMAKSIQDIFNQHYASYVNAISGMYSEVNKRQLGKDRINYGHVAEAFERHLSEHHSNIYPLLNSLSDADLENDNTFIQIKKLYNQLIKEKMPKGAARWDVEEDPYEAWRHIRESLGNLRGTVAGDVGGRQVKQAKGDDRWGATLSLASLYNLKDGFNRYSEIFSDTPPEIVAHKIAMYISSPISEDAKKMLVEKSNQDLGQEINKLERKLIRSIKT